MRIEFFTDHYGFVVDYLAEALLELRKHNFTEIIDRHFSLGSHLNARDVKAVRKTVSGEIMERVDLIFYSDPMMAALSLTWWRRMWARSNFRVRHYLASVRTWHGMDPSVPSGMQLLLSTSSPNANDGRATFVVPIYSAKNLCQYSMICHFQKMY
jgi:hypothetical protein